MSVQAPETSDAASTSLQKSTKKRKHETSEEELEIDLNLPEPPSKKARRKEKKDKSKKTNSASDATTAANASKPLSGDDTASATPKKGDHGIWIGNLPFSATPDKLREFFQDKGDIDNSEIVRLNMPGFSDDKKSKTPSSVNAIAKPSVNKGFAYVDFASKDVQEKALALSETLLVGRAVLIKDAKSYAGRPQPKAGEEGGKSAKTVGGKEPSKKVFVGNLGFDVTRDDLAEVLGKAGRIADCFLATFEDTGKCKGFGWVRFGTLEAAQAAVRGFTYVASDDADDFHDEEEDEEKKAATKKPKNGEKVYINKLHGRALRCEFAEDSQTRYKKRFGKDAPPSRNGAVDPESALEDGDGGGEESHVDRKEKKKKALSGSKMDKDQRRDERRKRHDARMIAPGQALARTPRASAAIVQGAGTKINFE